MRIRLFFILIFILFLVSSLWAFEISVDEKIPYRIYIGENKTIDWIDLVEIRALDNIDKILFQDLSPIEEIYKFESEILSPVYIITKKKSVWKLYWYYDPLDCILELEYPYIKRYTDDYLQKLNRKEKLIYKR